VLAVIVAVTMASVANVAAAETYDWALSGGGSWATTANWTVSGAPAGSGWPAVAGDVANLSVDLTGNATVVIDGSNTLGPVTFGGLTLADTGAAYSAWTINTTNTASIVFDNTPAGTYALLSVVGGTANNTINSVITLSSTLSIVNESRLTLSGTIIGANGIVKSGTGRLDITTGNSTFSGGFTLANGYTTFNTDSNPTSGVVTKGPFGIGTLTFAGGRLGSAGYTRTVGNAVMVASTADMFFGDPNDTNDKAVVLTGTMTFAGTQTTVYTVVPAIFQGRLVGSSAITVMATPGAADARLELSGNNSAFSGDFAVLAGQLKVTSGSSWGSSVNQIVVGGTTGAYGVALYYGAATTNSRPILFRAGSSGTAILGGYNGAVGCFAGTVTIEKSIYLEASHGNNNTNPPVKVVGNIVESGGSYGITKIGSGGVQLGGSNTFTGPTYVNAGMLRITDPGALGATGTIYISGSGILALATTFDPLSRLDTAAAGLISIDATNAISNATFASLVAFNDSLRVGAGNKTTYTYSGAGLTTAGSTYRLGGGTWDGNNGTSTLVLANSVLSDISGTQFRSLSAGSTTNNADISYAQYTVLVLSASNGYSGGTVINPQSSITLGDVGALGAGNVQAFHNTELKLLATGTYAGGKTVTATGNFTMSATGAGRFTMDWSFIQGTRTLTVYARGTNAILELTGTLALTGGGLNVRTDNNSLVFLSGSNSTYGGRSVSIGTDGSGNGNLVLQNVDRLGNGNLNIADARLIFDGVTWEQFTGNRTAGYGSGTNQWQFSTSYGGFAARGTTLVIVANTNVFDRNAGLGSTLKINGTWYANAPVVIASDIMLSDVRQLAVAQQGPGVFGQPGSGIVYTISGNIGGTGTIRLDWPLNYMVAWNQMAELVLAGTNNTWTGGRNGSGRGGMAFDNAEVFVRFAGNASLPKGAGSSTAYLMATRNNNANTEAFGYLLTTSTSGERYTLPGNYRFFIGAQGNASDPRYGVFGASSGDGVAGSAEFTKSTIIAAGLTSTNASQGSLALMVRDGLLTLGSTGVLATDGAVNFVPGAMILSGSLTAPANPVTHSVTTFTLKKSGEGTLVLGNVNYTDVTSSTNTASQFKWQIGGAGGGTNFQGAVRETGSDQWNSTAAFPLSIQNGVLELGAGDFTRPLGTSAGQVVLNSGGFAAFGGVRTVNIGGASGTLSWNVNFLSSAGALIFGSLTADNRIDFQNPINLNGGTRTIQTIHGSEAGAVVDLQGEITNGALTFGNALTPWSTALTAGKAIMSGSMSYTGTTMVNAGSVIFNGQGVASDSPIVVAAGLTVGGSAMLNRPMILGTGATLTPGNSIGTLGVTDLSLDNAILNWDLAIGSVGDTVLASSNLTAAGVSTFNFSGSFGAGLYNLIDYGTFSGTITNFAMNGSAPGGLNWLLRDNTESGAIQLLIYASANEWASTTGGDWSTGTNWTGGVPNAIGADANFGSNLASADTVNLDIAPTVGAIKFDNANKYTIGGTYTLTLATSSGNASIQVDTGSHEIAAPVTLGSDLAANIAGDLLTISGPMDGPYGVTKTGAGKLEINGTATYTGTTHVVNGELALGAAQTLGAVVIDSSALVTLVDGATQISSLEIAGGSSAPEAKLDIMSSALIIDYSGSESPLAEIEALIIKGYNGGDWAGNGITSSVLFDITAEAIGVIDNTTFLGGGLGEFAGRSIGMETVLVRKVIAGDIDMSGEVNAADYFYIDFNLDTAGGGWGAGDLDYSGETNSADYFYIDFNLGMSEGASMGTSIPEPATLVLLTLGGLAVIRRKRK
jgi:autotransporter-associated beta strand protein